MIVYDSLRVSYECIMNGSSLTEIGMTLIAVTSLLLNFFVSYKSIKLAKNTLQCKNLSDIHREWKGVNDIDCTEGKISGPDVREAVNAMSFTASHWNSNTINKKIVFEQYSDTFISLYDKLSSSNNIVPGYDFKCKETITSEITKCYESMKRFKNTKM